MRERSTVSDRPSGRLVSEEANVFFGSWSLARSVRALLDDALAPSGIGADDFAVYSVLQARGAITPTELAAWLKVPATTVSSYIKRFQGRGHLQRTPHPEDGRSSLIKLTAAGRRQHRATARLFAPRLRQVEETLGPLEIEVRRALETLRVAVDDVRDHS